MSAYTQPIFIAAIGSVLIVFAIFIPWLIYTYRKYGFLSFSKMMIVFSFIFYCLSALFLVLLPLPQTTDTCALQKTGTQFYNLRPLTFVTDILKDSGIVLRQPGTWIQTIKQPAFYQAFFNFLLLMPLGVYLRYFLRERRFWLRAFFIGLAVTFFFELTQVTGIYGIYNCPYRIFDVDDLLLNSVGSLVGFFVAPVLLALFPKHEEVVQRGQTLIAENIVRPIHRFSALAIDLLIIDFSANIVFIFLNQTVITAFICKTILYIVFLLLIPLLGNGATVGMRLLKIRFVDEISERATFKNMLRTFLALYSVFLWFNILRFVNAIELNMESSFYLLQIIITLLSFALMALSVLLLVVHIVYVLLKGKQRFFYEVVGKVTATRK